MKLVGPTLYMFVVAILCGSLNSQSATSASPAAVPRLVNFSGRATDVRGKVTVGVVGVTFSIYKDQYEGVPLWMETQNVQADKSGNYMAQLGAAKSEGLPLELFTTNEARWLGVRVNGGEEQPRVLLLSVPYALKAADAETVGGLPASAFVLASPASGGVSASSSSVSSVTPAVAPPPATITGAGTTNFVPLFTGTATVGNSVLFQSGSGTTAKIGINTSTPAATLDVKGTGTFRGALTLPATAPATTAAGKTSQLLNLIASTFNSVSGTPVNQTFRLETEPVGNNTASTSGTLNLLYASGANAATETGLKIASNGNITFAAGQTFPGTVKSVGLSAPATDFNVASSPVTGTGTLGLNWKVAPTSANTANAIVKRDATGSFTAGSIAAAGLTVNSTDASGNFVINFTSPGSGLSVTATKEAIFGTSADFYGIVGTTTASNDYAGVRGLAPATGTGVQGTGLVGVDGEGYAFYPSTGVHGNATLYGVTGTGQYGVVGQGWAYGVWGEANDYDGVHGVSHDAGGSGVGALNDAGGDGLYAAVTAGGYAGFFYGDVDVDGNLTKAAGSFKFDDPLDPANKYLYHSFVESPDMMNIYNGNVTLDGNGEAFVALPEWFQKLNRDFRYQLTCLDGFAPIFIAQRVQGNRFKIAGGRPGMEVSWQVTGVRQDAWANAHRIPVEQAKPEKERGSYLHPELFGAPAEKSIAWARHPETMKRVKERQLLPAPLQSLPASAQR